MKKIQTPTILHLVLIGFLVVLLPMIAGMVRSFESLGKMARQYESDTSRIVMFTEESQTLQGNLVDLERAARQYNVMGDRSYLQVFNDRFTAMRKSLQMVTDSGEEKLSPLASLMLSESEKLNSAINGQSIQTPQFEKELARFERLFFLSQTLRQEVSSFLSSRVTYAKASADGVSTELLVYVLTLLPLTLVLVSFFTVQILKPLRQIDRTIRKLGEGNYHQSFELQGPRDLQKVAERLSWLGRRLIESDEEKARFLRHISHELKTPLSTIKEGTELLEDQIPGELNPAQKEVVEILSKAVDNFQSLINNLLDYNLLKRDPILHRTQSSIAEVVQDTLSAHKLTAERKKISLKVRGDELYVKADRSVLKAALDNLISNAVHYTPNNGFVDIQWKRVAENRGLLINVRDSGPGIPELEKDKIFLPFYQGKARKQGPLKGTGLGLSVARECIESHGGQIRIQDSKIGAHFQIELPEVVVAKELG